MYLPWPSVSTTSTCQQWHSVDSCGQATRFECTLSCSGRWRTHVWSLWSCAIPGGQWTLRLYYEAEALVVESGQSKATLHNTEADHELLCHWSDQEDALKPVDSTFLIGLAIYTHRPLKTAWNGIWGGWMLVISIPRLHPANRWTARYHNKFSRHFNPI